MAKHDVNFRHGGPLTGDSGERGDNPPGIDAIKPYSDGERAVAANFDRPPENLRQRTEVLRGETEEQKYLQDGDMRWILASGNADGLHLLPAAWPMIDVWEQHPTDPLNRWYFSLLAGAAVVVQPLNTPRIDLQESKTWSFPLAGPFTGAITLYTNRRAYSNANIREVVWQALNPADIVGTHGVAGICDLLVSGEDNHILTITISNLGNTQLFHLNAAFLGYAVMMSAAGFLGGVDGWSNPLTFVTIADIPPLEVDYIFSKTFDRELHYIQSATFDAFFAASADNLLDDGDSIAVMWDYMVNPNPLLTDGRRQAIPANGAATEVLVGRLFKTSLHPEWIPLGIPLCKRIDKELLWLDGTVATEGMTTPVRFGENGYTVERIYSAPTTVPITMGKDWYDTTWPWPSSAPESWTTVQEALDGIVKFLAGTQDPVLTAVDPELGVRLIGVPEITTPNPKPSLGYYEVPALGSDLKEVIHQMLILLNLKGSLDKGTTFGTNEETVTGRWRFDNHIRIGTDKVVLRKNTTDHHYVLVYRNNEKSETNLDVDWSTYSVYEYVRDGESCSTVEVWGAYLDSGGSFVTAPAAGGPGTVAIHIPTLNITAFKLAATAGSVLHLNDADEWDVWQYWGPAVGMDESGSPEMRFAHYYEGLHTASPMKMVEFWMIDQSIGGMVDYIARDVDGTPSTKYAKIEIASSPWSLPLEGFYAQPEYMFGATHNSYTDWSPNLIVVSPGRALVDGSPVMCNAVQPLVASAIKLPSVTLPATDALLITPKWYYLWLRSDGTFRIGEKLPILDMDRQAPGHHLYRIDASEAETPTYQQRHYTLVDVVSLMYIAGGHGYWDCAPAVGGGERRLVYRQCPIDLGNTVHYMFRLTVDDETDPVETPLNYKSPGEAFTRSPGIPTGVTSKAAIYYHSTGTIAHDQYTEYRIGYNAGPSNIFPHPAGNNGLYPFSNAVTSLSSCLNAYHHRRMENTGDNPIDMNDGGRLEITSPCYYGGICWSQLKSTALTKSLSLGLLGFYWDRSAGPQGLNITT